MRTFPNMGQTDHDISTVDHNLYINYDLSRSQIYLLYVAHTVSRSRHTYITIYRYLHNDLDYLGANLPLKRYCAGSVYGLDNLRGLNLPR